MGGRTPALLSHEVAQGAPHTCMGPEGGGDGVGVGSAGVDDGVADETDSEWNVEVGFAVVFVAVGFGGFGGLQVLNKMHKGHMFHILA